MKIINRFLCYFYGHPRGKRADDVPLQTNYLTYRCRRCGALWSRKLRSPKGTAA